MKQSAEYYKEHEKSLYIETVSGKRFYYDDPVFDINDMAHALGMQCRYTGHTSRFYSVAEHSILVARICGMLDLADPFEGLMHDGTEAYISDIAAPWKALLPDYKKIEGHIEKALRLHWHLPEHISEGCKRADWLALFVEARHLMVTKAVDWLAPPGIKEQAATLNLPIVGFHPLQAREKFLEVYEDLHK